MNHSNDKPLVSVIMPVYNAENFLENSVRSVLSQSFKEFELICFNDASTDGSLGKLKHLASEDERIKIIDSPVNIKQGGGRNRGLRLARGKYVMFLDSDDSLADGALEKCVDAARQNDSEAVFFDYYKFRSDKPIAGAISPLGRDAVDLRDDELRFRILNRTTPVWSAMYKKSVIADNELYFPEGVFYEDNAVALAMQLIAQNPIKINESLYGYRSDNFSVTRSRDNYHFFDRIDSAVTLLGHCRRLGLYDRFAPEIDFIFINQYLVHTVYGAIYRFSNVQTERIKQVTDGIVQYLPDYKKNKYFRHLPASQKLKLFTHIHFPHLIKFLSNLKARIRLKSCISFILL